MPASPIWTAFRVYENFPIMGQTGALAVRYSNPVSPGTTALSSAIAPARAESVRLKGFSTNYCFGPVKYEVCSWFDKLTTNGKVNTSPGRSNKHA